MVVRDRTLKLVGLRREMRNRPSSPPCGRQASRPSQLDSTRARRGDDEEREQTHHRVPDEVDLAAGKALADELAQDLCPLLDRRARRHAPDHDLCAHGDERLLDADPVAERQRLDAREPDRVEPEQAVAEDEREPRRAVLVLEDRERLGVLLDLLLDRRAVVGVDEVLDVRGLGRRAVVLARVPLGAVVPVLLLLLRLDAEG